MKKRIFDLALTISALFVLAPVIVVLIVLLRFSMGKGIFFYQNRPGLHGRPFTIYKFRTMTDERDENGNLLPDGERLTRLGRFLRKTSMDPQITQIFAD
jgi:lipopolysaccharide/colanic/teichoic acid biosynthesis glycosyltransferase